MPTYEVTDPTTGRTLELTGDSPPTEKELTDIFSRYGAAPAPKTLGQRVMDFAARNFAEGAGDTAQLSPGDQAAMSSNMDRLLKSNEAQLAGGLAKGVFNLPKTIGDVALGIPTGIAAWPVSAASGVVAQALTKDPEFADRMEAEAAERAQWQPQTEGGRTALEALAKVVDPFMSPAKELGKMVGESWESPLMERLARFGGEVGTFGLAGKVGALGKAKLANAIIDRMVKNDMAAAAERAARPKQIEAPTAEDVVDVPYRTAPQPPALPPPLREGRLSNPIIADALLKAAREKALPGPEGMDMNIGQDFTVTPSRALADMIIRSGRGRLPAGQTPMLPEPPASSPVAPEIALLAALTRKNPALPPGQGFELVSPEDYLKAQAAKVGQKKAAADTILQKLATGEAWLARNAWMKGTPMFENNARIAQDLRAQLEGVGVKPPAPPAVPASATRTPARPPSAGLDLGEAGARPEPVPPVLTKKGAGANNIIGRIQELGGINAKADYSPKYLRQYPDLRRVLNAKTGLNPDDIAATLKAEGYPVESGDALIEALKDGRGREMFAPEKADELLERKLRREENEWIEARLADLEAQEGIDAGTEGEGLSDLRGRLSDKIKAEGLVEAEAALRELDDFFSSVREPGKRYETGAEGKLFEKRAPYATLPPVTPKKGTGENIPPETTQSPRGGIIPEESVVRDIAAKPIPVYHGSSNTFDKLTAENSLGVDNLVGYGIYTTESPMVAAGYTTKGTGTAPSLRQVYLDIRNPLDFDKAPDASFREEFMDRAIGEGWNIDDGLYQKAISKDYSDVRTFLEEFGLYKEEMADESLTQIIENMGYDGITHVGGTEKAPHRVWVAFNDDQVIYPHKEIIPKEVYEKYPDLLPNPSRPPEGGGLKPPSVLKDYPELAKGVESATLPPVTPKKGTADISAKDKPQAEAGLIEAARKYSTVQDFINSRPLSRAKRRQLIKQWKTDNNYQHKDAGISRGDSIHSPAGPGSGSPLYNLTENGTYPEDVYSSNGLRYYGFRGQADAMERLAYNVILETEGQPNKLVTVYRAVEKDGGGKIIPGDWVTTVRQYAKEHGESNISGGYKILKEQVRARDLFTSGDSFLEYGYHPQERVYDAFVRDAFKKAHDLPNPTRPPEGGGLDISGTGGRIEARRAGYDEKQLDIDLETYGRGVSSARGKMAAGGGVGATVKASGIPADFKRSGFVSLSGTKVEGPGDLAAVAQIFRDPRIETLRIFYIKDGKVVAHEGLSSRMPHFSQFYAPKDIPKEVTKIIRRMRRVGANQIYLLHNHPTGNPKASAQDVAFTDFLDKNLSNYAKKMGVEASVEAHVIIDHEEYAVVRPRSKPETFLLDEASEKWKAGVPHDLLGTPIDGSEDVIRIAGDLKTPRKFATLIFRTSDGTLGGIQDVPLGIINGKDVAGYVRNRAVEFGSAEAALVLRSMKDMDWRNMRSLIEDAVFQDIVAPSGEGVRSNAVKPADDAAFGLKTSDTRYDPQRVAEETKPYAAADPIVKRRIIRTSEKTKLEKDVRSLEQVRLKAETELAGLTEARFTELKNKRILKYQEKIAELKTEEGFLRRQGYQKAIEDLKKKDYKAHVEALKTRIARIDAMVAMRKAKAAATKDVTDIKAPAVRKSERDFLKSLPDLRWKPLEGKTENPIYTLEHWADAKTGEKLKELFYYPFRTAHHKADLHFDKIHGKLEMFRKELPSASSRNIYTHALFQEKGGAEILAEMGVKEPPKLTPAETKAYNWMRRGYEVMFDKLNKARVEAGLEPFRKVANYFTFARDLGLAEQLGFRMEDPLFAEHMHRKATAFQYAKERVGGMTKADLDAFGVFDRYMRSATRHVHLSPAIAKMRELLGTFREGKATWTFADKHPRGHKALTELIDYVSGQRKKSVIDPILNLLNHNITTATLSANLRSALIQPTALLNTYIEIGPKYTAIGTAKLARKINREGAMKDSETLFGRQFDVSVAESLQGAVRKMGKAREKWNKSWFGMRALRELDLQTATATWEGAYTKAIEVDKMTPEAARRYADDVVVRTQGSAAPHDLAPIQRTALGKALTLFQTFVINNWNFLTKKALGIKNADMGNKAITGKVIRLVIGTTIINSLFDLMGVYSPLPAPIEEFGRQKERGKSAGEALTSSALEFTQLVPGLGGLRYGSGVLGATADYVGDVAKKTAAATGRYVGPTKPVAELIGKALGIPGTTQASKSIRIAKKGGSPADIILGRYPQDPAADLKAKADRSRTRRRPTRRRRAD